MNIYNVTLMKPQGCIRVRSYVVAATSEEEAVFGGQLRAKIHEYVTEWSEIYDEAPDVRRLFNDLAYYELPITREEARLYGITGPARDYEVTVVANDIDTPYENGDVICCDYYPG